jgi:hypothetical protein
VVGGPTEESTIVITTGEERGITETEPTERLCVRGTSTWVAWIDATARRAERSRSSLFAAALLRYAEAEGLPAPPPRI